MTNSQDDDINMMRLSNSHDPQDDDSNDSMMMCHYGVVPYVLRDVLASRVKGRACQPCNIALCH